MNIKFTASVAVVALTVLLTGASAYAQTNSRLCNNELIRGDYAFVVDGYKLGGAPGSPLGPMKGVAMTTFDGKGHLTQLDTIVVNGTQTSSFSEDEATGTYQVNPNCTGTFTLTFPSGDPRPPVTVSFVVGDNGNEVDTVVISPPGALLVGSVGKRRFSIPALPFIR
jgi:hypothetical protein